MSERKQPSVAGQRRFRVGDKARMRLGASRPTVEIVEDRGNIGVGGRRLFRVRLLSCRPEEQQTFEVPTGQLTSVSPSAPRTAAPKRKANAT